MLFEELMVNGLRLRNRILRSATWEGMCDNDGAPTQRLLDCYVELARGGVGLIITGYAYVTREGRQLPGQMGLDTDERAGEFKRLTGAVQRAGGVIAAQLVHAGGQTTAAEAGRRPLAPSSVGVEQFPEIPEELTLPDIERIIKAFGEAALRARALGFDGVQLHGAHGYLINQFLSPHTNTRGDRYGGDIDGRGRFLFEVYEEVRRAVGRQYPVMIKLTGSDYLEGGFTEEDALYVASQLSEMGIDAIEISSGTRASGDKNPAREHIDSPYKEGYNVPFAGRVKASVSCPVGAVGGVRSYEVAEAALGQGGLDFVSMSRPLIWEPDLAARWQSGDREPARCISCNGCFAPGLNEGGICCVVKKRWERRL
ncbi:MAG: NADH:flavin oxidoreductase [Thermodesulfobacteriota bacterium]